MTADSVVRTVRLTVITDFGCICCCIGQHELQDAIKHCKDTLNLPLRFEIEHIPFRLVCASALPDESKFNREDFLMKSLGRDRFIALQSNVAKWSQEKGIPLSLKGIFSPTTKAHRLVLKAGKLGGQAIQRPFIDAIFTASMEEGKDTDDPDVLADLAAKSGVMSREATLAFLNSGELAKEVEEMQNAARAKGVTGVPMIIIDGKWAVSGSQSCDVYVQIFKKLATCQGAQCAQTPIPSNIQPVNCVDTSSCLQ